MLYFACKISRVFRSPGAIILFQEREVGGRVWVAQKGPMQETEGKNKKGVARGDTTFSDIWLKDAQSQRQGCCI